MIGQTIIHDTQLELGSILNVQFRTISFDEHSITNYVLQVDSGTLIDETKQMMNHHHIINQTQMIIKRNK